GCDAGRTFAKLARWQDQNVFNAAGAPVSPRTCRSFPARRIFAAARERDICRVLRQFREGAAGQMDRCDRATALFANWFSADWRAMERYNHRVSRDAFPRACARSFYLP